jgi:tRNA-dihydrouridine synthase
MLGRGILQNPFLAEEIINIAEKRKEKGEGGKEIFNNRFMDFYKEYAEILCVLKGEKIALSSLKELWHYFAVFWKLNSLELKSLLQINDYHTFEKSISNKI